eukprot:7742197-Lingulodinium_polyedra.AAC.1
MVWPRAMCRNCYTVNGPCPKEGGCNRPFGHCFGLAKAQARVQRYCPPFLVRSNDEDRYGIAMPPSSA